MIKNKIDRLIELAKEIPQEGIDEALESLEQIRGFYNNRTPHAVVEDSEIIIGGRLLPATTRPAIILSKD